MIYDLVKIPKVGWVDGWIRDRLNRNEEENARKGEVDMRYDVAREVWVGGNDCNERRSGSAWTQSLLRCVFMRWALIKVYVASRSGNDGDGRSRFYMR